MLFYSSCQGSSPSLNLLRNHEGKLQSRIDSSLTEIFPACSLDSRADTSQSIQLGGEMHQADFLDKSNLDLNTLLIDMVCNDNAKGLIGLLQKMALDSKVEYTDGESKLDDPNTTLGYWFPHRLLQLACQMDAANCATVLVEGQLGLHSPVNAVDEEGKTALHFAASNLSTQCVKLLLQNHAKTDLCANDGSTPLKSALQNRRWQTSLQTLPAIEIIRFLKTKDLTAVKLLAGHTKDVLHLACRLVFEGNAAALAALILAAGKSLFVKQYRYESFLDLILEKTLSCRKEELEMRKAPHCYNANANGSEDLGVTILKCLEIIVDLKAELTSFQTRDAQRNKSSALLKAVQAGDEVVVKILLKDITSVTETDPDGNTALHWCLRASSATKGLRIVWQLIMHGAAVDARNRLGLTPVHIAAGRGNLQALQLLLAHNPDAAHIAAETKESPLFLAVKNNHVECAKFLLRLGSKAQVLSLRRQKPIDFASSQEMRMILTQDRRHATGKAPSQKSFLNCNYFSTFMLLFAGKINERKDPQSILAQSVPENPECDTIDLQINKLIQAQEDFDDSYWLQVMQNAKTVMCRYHMLPSGCARGDGCLYAHAEHELRPLAQGKVKATDASSQKKIFVGGLSPAVESEDLREHFGAEFGPVEDAVVMSSQTGLSRGFGFVTFREKASFCAAVRQKYLAIFGKRVEIKTAIQPPKMGEESLAMYLSAPELMPAEHEVFETNNGGMANGESGATSRDQTAAMVGTRTAATIRAESLSVQIKHSRNPTWLEVFKKWLPVFLSDVSKRQQGGEFYPLSSIKADFRATCGMELDHVSLGFPKLSDLLRTIPELCRMKIVPVGRGPATHVILQAHRKSIGPKSGSRIVSSSLVHEGRTYAAAAGHKIEDNEGAQQSPEPPHMSARVGDNALWDSLSMTGTKCDHNVVETLFNFSTSMNPSDSFHAFLADSSSRDCAMHRYTGPQHGHVIEENMPLFSKSDGEEQQQSYLAFQEVKTFPAWQQGLTANNVKVRQNLQRQSVHASFTNTHLQSIMSETSVTRPPCEHSLHTFAPLYTNLYTEQTEPFPPLADRPKPKFRSIEVPCYNPCNSELFGGYRSLIQQANIPATGEESPQSTLTSEGSVESPEQSQEGSPVSCAICGNQTAVWVAFPCAHKSMCSPCKKLFDKRNQSPHHCFICQGRTTQWIAHYF